MVYVQKKWETILGDFFQLEKYGHLKSSKVQGKSEPPGDAPRWIMSVFCLSPTFSASCFIWTPVEATAFVSYLDIFPLANGTYWLI